MVVWSLDLPKDFGVVRIEQVIIRRKDRGDIIYIKDK